MTPAIGDGRLRLLFVDHTPAAGGSQLVLVEHIRSLDTSRFDVHLACRRGTRAASPVPRRRRHGPRRGNATASRRAAGNAAEGRAGAAHLRKTITHHAIDLVVANTARTTYVVWLATRGLRVPVMWWVRDFLYSRRLFAMLGGSAARIVFVSKALREFYGGGSDDRQLVWPVASGIHEALEAVQPAAIAEARRQHGLDAGATVIGFMGRLVEEKGAGDLVAAFARIADEFPSAAVLIVGSGRGQPNDAEDALQRDVARRGLTERIRFAGFQWNEALYYSLFDIFVLATRDFEGYPTSVVQAMMAGKPVIGSAVGGTPEIVLDGETGRLYPPGDVDALARALRALLTDATERGRLAAAARRKVMTENRQAQLADTAAATYVSIVRGARPPGRSDAPGPHPPSS